MSNEGLWPTYSKELRLPANIDGSDDKESACNSGDLGSNPGLGRSPGGGHGNPLQYSCLENPHGQRSLTGYSPTKSWTHGSQRVGYTEGLSTPQLKLGLNSTLYEGI